MMLSDKHSFFRLSLALLFMVNLTQIYAEEVYLTFPSSLLTVKCGEPGRQQFIQLKREAGINEEYAVELNWTINAFTGKRERIFNEEVTTTGLDYGEHDGSSQVGKNRSGYIVKILRTPIPDTNKYTYRQSIEPTNADIPCEIPHPGYE